MSESLLLSAADHSNGDALLARARRRFGEGFSAAPIDGGGAAFTASCIPAAVLVPIVLRAEPTMLLTRRTAHLRDHGGQISFPGGRCEPDDASAEATALREAEEEVGLDPDRVEILGRLPQYLTGTGFTITPVVGLVTPPLNLKLDDFEVAEVFEPPLSFLLDANNHQRQQREFNGVPHEFWAMPWNDYYIWGATAGMLVSLHDVLFGESS